MKRNFIHHLRWTKSNILYFAITAFYFFIIVPTIIFIEIANPEFQITDVINISAFVFNIFISLKNIKRLQKGWEEFYLTDIDVVKNVIMNKTCDNCQFCLRVEVEKFVNPLSFVTKTKETITKGECRILKSYRLKEDDLLTCKHFEEIPEHIKNCIE